MTDMPAEIPITRTCHNSRRKTRFLLVKGNTVRSLMLLK